MKSSLLPLLGLVLALSFVLSIAAVPASRSLKSIQEKSALQDLTQDLMVEEGDLLMGEGLLVEGRMALGSSDYPGTGANNRHDPRSPGRN